VYDIIIIGGGIVGLASAYEILKHQNLKVLILEKENEVAVHQSGRNSGVLHTGIYYTPGSLKAKNCIEGYGLMIEFCEQFNIPYEICGKLIVATNESELPALEKIYQNGLQNAMTNIKIINRDAIKSIEPHVEGIKAIHVPHAGIVDYKKVAQQLQKLLEAKGCVFRFNEKVVQIQNQSNCVSISTTQSKYETKKLINCAGLYSDEVAKLHNLPLSSRIIPFRGEYFQLKAHKKYLVNHLVYPVPDPSFPFLGVHFTRRINGEIEAGPNAVFAFRKEGYRFSDFDLKEFKHSITYKGFQKIALQYWKKGIREMFRSISKRTFTKSLQQLIPELKMNDLIPAPAGVRAQAISDNGQLLDDFHILTHQNCIHVINAPSPAATASFAIGKHISDLFFYP
jgi:L-2-hydroxyglutarate oxidase